MTREEVIVDLQGRIDIADKYYPLPKQYREALAMAIQVLKQEPCEDAISRKVAVDAIMGQSPELHYPSWYAEQIKALPPVTPQKKMGRWIAVENEEMKTVGYYCSECDLPMETEYRTKFCPICGAKMEDVEE